jgi:uridine phosphorylase
VTTDLRFAGQSMSVAAGGKRRSDLLGETLVVRVFVPTWAEALPLLRWSPRVSGIGRRQFDLADCDAVLLAGFAGACQPHLRPGDVVLSGDVAPCLSELRDEVRTLDHIASPSEKAALGARGVAAVDMEGRWLAEAAAGAGVPFLNVRSIIDGVTASAVGLGSVWHYKAACRGLRRAVTDVLRVWPARELLR